MNKLVLLTLLGLGFGSVVAVIGGERGVVNDPDGFTNVREEPTADAAIIAKVRTGEVFEFESVEGSSWWGVTLASGKSGWMHHSRIRFHFTLDEIPEKDEEGSEVALYAKEHGFDYCATARAAAQGQQAAMTRFFAINDTDGGAAEVHAGYFNQVVHLLGDQKLAAFLAKQSLELRLDVRNQLSDFSLWPFEASSYLERHFPLTAKLLCRKQLTAWPSPDGRFVVRKTFSDACAGAHSKVMRAELIEKATGKVIADLTADDIGTGLQREGRVLWSPDSARFALFSSGDTSSQTIVYQSNGKGFLRLDSPKLKLPGRETDTELKGTQHLWTHEEPLHWATPDVLVLRRHEYFEGKHPDTSIRSIGRTYEVTRDMARGTASAKVANPDD